MKKINLLFVLFLFMGICLSADLVGENKVIASESDSAVIRAEHNNDNGEKSNSDNLSRTVNYWDGSSNYLWNTGSNWSLGHAPTTLEDVVITSDGYHPPNISSSTACCNNLSFESGAELTQTGGYFRVYGDFNSDSGTFTQSAAGYLYFDGDTNTYWDDDNEDDTFYNVRVDKDDSSAGVSLWQDMTVNNFEIREGVFGINADWTLKVTGTGEPAFQVEDGGKLDVLHYAMLIVAGGIEFEDGSQLETHQNSVIKCGGNFRVEENTAYDIEFGWNSWLKMNGTGEQYIQDLDGGNLLLYGLYIENYSGCVYIEDEDLHLTGTLNLFGSFSCKASPSSSTVHDIYIGGGWYRSYGSNFEESTGRVIFNGSFDSSSWGGDFNILEIAKESDAVFEVINGGSVNCNLYDWTSGSIEVEDGTFTAADLADNGIFGNYILHPDGIINLHQDIGSFIDVNGDITIEGGTMNVYGGSADSWWSYGNDASITMSGGILDFKDQGIKIYNGSNSLTENITGGIIRTSGDFTGDRADFTPVDGTIELYGSSDVNLSHGVGSSFYNVYINKSATRIKEKAVIKVDRNGNRISRDRANTVYAFSDLDLQGDLSISDGTFGLNGHTVDVSQNVYIYGTLQMFNVADILNIGDDIYWRAGSSSNITNGEINLENDWLFADGTNAQLGSNNTVSLNGSGNQFIYCLDDDAEFNDLVIDKTSWAAWIHSSSTDTMRVAGDMTVTAGDVFQVGTNDLLIEGTLNIEDTGALYLEHDGGTMTNNSDFTLNGELNINGGDALIHGTFELAETGTLTIDGGSFISDAPYSGTWQHLNGALNQSGGLFEITNNSINIGTLFEENITGGIFRFGASFNAGAENVFQPSGGVAEATAVQTGRNINCTSGNYFYDLQINGANTISISNDLIIQNDLDIDSGSLDSNSHTISLGGDWTNNVGDEGFLEEESTVIFNGANEADITTDETFYNMTLDKTNGQYYALELMDGITVNVLNDMNILDATLEMNDGSTFNIDNDLDIALNAGLNAYGDSGLNIFVGGNWNNDNSHHDSRVGFYPGNSTVSFDGDGEQTLTSNCTADSFYNVVVDKSAGNFRVSNNTEIFGDLTISSGSWHDNNNYLVHYIYGDFTVEEGAAWNGTTQNAVVFKGTADQDVTFDPTLTDGYFYDFYVDKTVSIPAKTASSGEELLYTQQEPKRNVTRAETVTLLTDIVSLGNGHLTIDQGTLDLNGNYYRCTGNVSVNDGGTISIDDNASLEVGNGHDLNINEGGILEMIGSAGNEALLTHHSGYYNINVESSGTVDAEYAIFEYMSAAGIEVKTGAVINRMSNCIFRNGIAGGTLLTIDNDQTFEIESAAFPENTWGSSYNVSKSENSGNVTFTNAIGDFAGPAYENDTYDRIHWTGFAPDLQVTSAEWSNYSPWICDTISVQIIVENTGNMSSESCHLDLYYNLGTPPDTMQVGDQFAVIPELEAGEIDTVTISNIWNDVSSVWNSYLQIDTNNEVTEQNENNNIWGPTEITWKNLPAIDDLTIHYNVVLNNIILEWTYPAEVDHFNIYRSEDPYDFSGAIVTTSESSSYSETAVGTKYFYRVTAEKDCTPIVISRKDRSKREKKQVKMESND